MFYTFGYLIERKKTVLLITSLRTKCVLVTPDQIKVNERVCKAVNAGSLVPSADPDLNHFSSRNHKSLKELPIL